MAVNCWVEPTTKFTGKAGAIAMEANVGAAITDKLTDGLVMPDTDAVILAVPVAAPVAKPVEDMVTAVILELAQVI